MKTDEYIIEGNGGLISTETMIEGHMDIAQDRTEVREESR